MNLASDWGNNHLVQFVFHRVGVVLEHVSDTRLESIAGHPTQLQQHGRGRGLVAMGMLVEAESLEGEVEGSGHSGTGDR